jgi:hypothetical protein
MNIQIATVCDYAADYQGKLCIQGAFDTLCAQNFPVVHPQCSIAIRVIFQPDDTGAHEFVIRCVDPEGKECLPATPPIQMDVKFERQGLHRWLVQHHGDTVASIPLRVTLFDDRRAATGPAG